MSATIQTASQLLSHAEACLQARQLHAAETAFAEAETAGAEPNHCRAGRWMTAMLAGNFEQAWCASDRIRASQQDDPHRFWNGEDVAGKRVMLRCLHGFGDTVQLLAYAPLLRRRAASLIVQVAPEMVELAPMFDGVDQVITWGDGVPEPAWDLQIEINELPYLFRTLADELPIAGNYLSLPAATPGDPDVAVHREGALRVGLVWASGEWNTARSVPWTQMTSLLSTPGVEFWNLQGGTARAQWNSIAPRAELHPAEDCVRSTVRLAELIAQMDLVVTTDTLAAHLAGALGTPAWVMLQHAADWRWQVQRSDSPWYPSLTLFRQTAPGDWQSVIDSVQRALHHAVANHGRRVA